MHFAERYIFYIFLHDLYSKFYYSCTLRPSDVSCLAQTSRITPTEMLRLAYKYNSLCLSPHLSLLSLWKKGVLHSVFSAFQHSSCYWLGPGSVPSFFRGSVWLHSFQLASKLDSTLAPITCASSLLKTFSMFRSNEDTKLQDIWNQKSRVPTPCTALLTSV
jgi:hypothetical protein